MAETTNPPRYSDPQYQAAHDDTFSHPLTPEIAFVLPPGVSKDDFDKAIAEFIDATDQNSVFTGPGLKDYVDPYEIPEAAGDRKVPSAAVCPDSVPQLQAVLKVANKYQIPLWTFSRGKNLGYGGPAPVVSGSVALDLHRMNKILEVNEKLAYAVVEPGVTFGDLYTYCVERKLKLWPSTASLGWGSVIGNTVDRGMGFIPTGQHHEHIAGLEVVLADGDIVRTGQFAMPNNPSAHLTRLSFGPTIDGLFLQSNLAIVTKMGINLTPQPQAYMAATFDMPEFEDIATITDVFGALRREGVLPSIVYVLSIVEWSSLFKKKCEWWEGEGPIPDWRIKEIQQELDSGWWLVRFGLYGPQSIIEAQYNEVKRVLEREAPTGRVRKTLFTGEDGGLLEATKVPQPYGGMYVGVPSLYSMPLVVYYNPKDGSGIGAHGAYSAVVPLDGKILADWAKAARAVYEANGFDLLCDFFMHDRHAVFVCMLCFDKTNQQQRVATDKIFRELFEEGKKRGFTKYRAHITHMEMVAELFDFNNHAYRRFVETLKDSLDPNGILSPGKMGIWPRRFRELRAAGSM